MANRQEAIVIGDVHTNILDPVTGKSTNYKEVTTYYDGTSMDNSKVDGDLYRRKGTKYLRKVIDKDGELFLEKDTMAQMRALTAYEILLLKAGVVKGVKLNGYYTKGDTPAPIDYYITDIDSGDDGGSILEIGNIKLVHHFVSELDIRYFGVSPNSNNDQTDIIQKAFNLGNGIKIEIPRGIFMIDAIKNINILSNTIVNFQEGAVFKAITNNSNDYRIINMRNVENITIYNPTVIGDKDTHTGTTGEGGHGIGIYFSKNIKIYNAIANKCWGVGLALVYVEDILIDNIICDDDRQNGIALVAGRNVTIKRPKCINNSGTAPAAGIDIEPNLPTDYLENINIIDPIFHNNEGVGMLIAIKYLKGSNNNVSISVDNMYSSNDLHGIEIASLEEDLGGVLSGFISIKNPIIDNSKQSGIFINNYCSKNSPVLEILEPKITNPNTDNYLGGKYGNGITVTREIGFTNTNLIGNLSIINPSIIDNRIIPKTNYNIWIYDEKDQGFSDLKIVDPIILGKTKVDDINYKFNANANGVVLKDRFKTISGNFTSTRALTLRGYTLLTNAGATSLVNFNLYSGDIIIDNDITFINQTIHGLRINPALNQKIIPLTTTVGKYIYSNTIGSSITLRKVSLTEYVIVNLTGEWKVQDNEISKNYLATTLNSGIVKQSTLIDLITTPDAIDATTNLSLTNANKAKINELITKFKTATIISNI